MFLCQMDQVDEVQSTLSRDSQAPKMSQCSTLKEAVLCWRRHQTSQGLNVTYMRKCG